MGSARRRNGAVWRSAVAVLLGLPPRRSPGPGERKRRSAAASSYESPAAATNGLQFGRAYWLPPFGRGNGIEALFWAPLAQVPGGKVDAALTALAEADIAAWAAPVRGAEAEAHDLAVASARLDDAQDVLMRVLAG